MSNSSSAAVSGARHGAVRCPACRHPVDALAALAGDFVCPSCGWPRRAGAPASGPEAAPQEAEQERVRLLIALEQDRARLDNLISSVPGVVWEAYGAPDGPAQRIDFVSQHVQTMLGYTVEQWLATPNFWLTIVHPADRERAAREAAAIFAAGRGGVSQFRWVARDGRVVWVEAQSRVLCDERNEPIGMRGVTMEITERKRAEQERTESLARERAARDEAEAALQLQRNLEERLTLLVRASDTLLGSLRSADVHGAVLELARRLVAADAHAVWRLTRETGHWRVVCTSGLSETFPDETIPARESEPGILDGPLIMEDIERESCSPSRLAAYRAERIRSLLAVPLKIHGATSGTIVFYYRDAHEFSDTDIQVASALANLAASALGTAQLYEQQSRVRAQAEEAERRSAFLAEGSRVLTSSLDYEATLAAVARLAVPHVADWCAVSIVEEGEGSIRQLAVAHADTDAVRMARARHLRRSHDRGIVRVIRSGRSELYAEIPEAAPGDADPFELARELGFCSAMLVPLVARDRTLGAITFATAESGRRYGPAELALAEDLAQRAALAVDNARLYASIERERAEAQAANRTKDEFLATVSHELRTPLNAMLGWARLLRSGTLNQTATARAIDSIERNAAAQAHLIEDLLDVSRIISGKLRLNVRPITPMGVIEGAIDAVRPAAEAKDIRIQPVLDPAAGPISADPDRLQQIVWNLVSNAVKFTPRGGQVEVRLARVDSHVEIVVSDTGSGITKEFLPHIFERFRQADSTTTRSHTGLGLGLAIARHLVELHGGTVSVHSDGEGRGATFVVKIPVMIVEETPESGRGEPGIRPTSGSCMAFSQAPRLDGLRLLLVDDEPDSISMLSTMLRSCGAEVASANSAAEAAQLLERFLPHVLITDIGMPGEDGYAFLRRVRMLPPERGGQTPAVALTAYARAEDRTRALLAGFQMHVPKPVELAELAAVIASLARRPM